MFQKRAVFSVAIKVFSHFKDLTPDIKGAITHITCNMMSRRRHHTDVLIKPEDIKMILLSSAAA